MKLGRREKNSTWLAFGLLATIYATVFLAPWIAPYDYFEQHRAFPLAPPTRLHFFDAEGRFHLRPFVYRAAEHPERLGEYIEEKAEIFPLQFFVKSPVPRRWGPFETRLRLFGVDEDAHIFLFGTDRFGRDVFSRLLYGGRMSLSAGLLAGLAALGFGLVVGAAAGYFGGGIDAFLMRTGELFMAFPSLFLLVTVRAALPLDLDQGKIFFVTVTIISLLAWVDSARLVRGVVLTAKERDFVRAARGFGASGFYLLWRHVLPQTWPVVSTHLALTVPRLVLVEVTLSFLGLGITEPLASWGLMLAELKSYDVLVSRWWMSVPAVALTGVVIGYHHLASVLRRRSAA